MNLSSEMVAALGVAGVVAVLVLGAMLEAWIDYREDTRALREWEERTKARNGGGEE